MNKKSGQAVIKKYANRRLYNTQISCYITLEDLHQMVKKEEDFIVVDAKTGEDLTRITLTQIILEQQDKSNMLPADFLKKIINLYSSGFTNVLPDYLDFMMNTFNKNREQFEQISKAYMKNDGMNLGTPLFKVYDEIYSRNLEMLEQISKLWIKK